MLSDSYIQNLQEWRKRVLDFWKSASTQIRDGEHRFKYDLIGPPSKPSNKDLNEYAKEFSELEKNKKSIVFGATEELVYLLLLNGNRVTVVDFCQDMINRLKWQLTEGINKLNKKIEPFADEYDLKLLNKSNSKSKLKTRIKFYNEEWHNWTKNELKQNTWKPEYELVCCDAGIPTFLYGKKDYRDLLDKFTYLINKNGKCILRAHVHEPNKYNEPPGSIENLLLRVNNIITDDRIPVEEKSMRKEKLIREYCAEWIRDSNTGLLSYTSYHQRLKEHGLSPKEYKLLSRPLAELGNLVTYVPEPSDFGGLPLDFKFEISYIDPTELHSPICIAKRV